MTSSPGRSVEPNEIRVSRLLDSMRVWAGSTCDRWTSDASIGRAAAALWWFHPLVLTLERWARRECERAAADAVLLSGSRASDYAEHVLDSMGHPWVSPR